MGKSTERTKLLENNGLHRKFSYSAPKGALPDEYPSVPFLKLYKFSTGWDKFFLIIGAISSMLAGISYSYFAINLGSATSVIVTYVQSVNENSTQAERDEAGYYLDDGLMNFVIINCSLAGAIMVASYISTLIFNYTALNQTYKMRELFLRSVLNQDIAWHDVNQTGDFSSRISDDLKKVEEGIGEKTSMFLYFATVFVSCIIQALILGWELTLVCMLSLPLTAIGMTCVACISSKLAMKETDAYGAAGAVAEEVFGAVRTVVAFGGEQSEQNRYDKLLSFACKNNIRRALFHGTGEGFTWLVSFCNYSLGFWYGVNLIIRDRGVPLDEVLYTPGNMIAIFFSVYSASWYFSMLSSYMEIFGVAKGAATKIFGTINSKPKINLSKGNGLRYGKIDGKITFKNVHFEYPSRSDVKILKGLDLVINPGETVALVGSSGCGKSTCIQLIQRFYDPTFGNVYIDDNNLQEYDLSWIRSYIGVVGQEPVLFEATIAENIRLGCQYASMDEIEEAARKANAHSFIKALPQRYNTLVGERGTQLSGGQKQRIAIARALVRKPSILLLDEATSALDTNSEAVVQAALEAASSECTTVIVAHRLSTVKKADRIIVISQGLIQEQGTHHQLMEQKGAYYELITSQVSQDEVKDDDVSLLRTGDTAEDLSRKDSIDSDLSQRPSLMASYIKEILQEEKVDTTSIYEILKHNSPEWYYIVIGCLCSVITGATMPVFAIVYGKVVGVLAVEDNAVLLSSTEFYSLCFLLIGIVVGTATFTQVYFFGCAGEKLTMRLRSLMFKSFLSQEIAYFDNKNHSVGALCALLAGEAASVQGATGHRLGTILSSMSTIVFAVLFSFYFEWRITLVVLVFAPIIVGSVFVEKRMITKESRKHYQTLQTSTKIAVEAINAIRTVVSLGCEDTFHNMFMAEIVPYQRVAQCNTHFRGISYAISRTLMLFAYAAAFYYGSQLVKNENIDYSAMFIVAMAVITSSWSIAKGFAFTPNLQKGLIAAGRIIQTIKRVPLICNGSNDANQKWTKANVKYEQVHFSYPTRPNIKVLNGLDLSMLQGKTVALVGSSGCGKSTIVQLLERFYDPISGTVSVDGQPIDTMHLFALRSQLGIVSQEPNLFSRTISENISYGDNSRTIPQSEIIEAAKSANIHDFVVSLPLGYDTKLGEKGTQLSGGQKQRIAIARALVRNPRILLLDEATSALDAESEKIVQEALDNARIGRTCITIAHRLSTIQEADLICVISQGRVAEKGTHRELLNLKELYYNLYRLQQ